MVPHVSHVAGRMGERTSVYYCIDDYAAMPGVNARAVRWMDEELTRKAGVVFVASATLEQAKRRWNRMVRVNPHGVDVEHFANAQNPALPIPGDIAAVKGPVVGFFGLIERWIDLDLVETLARQRPAWTFVLIGRVCVPGSQLPALPNVRFLGPRLYEALPAYGKRFDAAIIPYRLTDQVLHANPLKLREYLAMGKPVVSVRTPEIERFADVVRIADSGEVFLRHLDEVLACGDCPREISRRMARVGEFSWTRRVDDAWTVVSQAGCSVGGVPQPGEQTQS
jgi:glycosyltransferase involved in cell wall biosynthesis